MKLFKRLSFAAVLISATALTTLNAQSTPDSEGNDANLIAPDGQQLFGKNDPNVRRATAQVNGEIITGTDMDHRLALIVAANENKLPPEELARFRAQILTNLIDETLQIQEAAANKIEVTDAEVDQYFDRVAQQNFKRPANQVEKYLTSIGASVATLKRQIKGELSWSRLLSRNVRPSANVSDDEVNAIIERIKATKGTTEYRLGEIYLSATPEAMPAVTENAKKIIDQLRQGANFVAYARQFSEASTASVGGDLGWLSLAQLPSSLATAAAGMNSNEVQAVASPGGISILLLIDKRQVAMLDPRDSVLSLKQIAITFPAGTAEAQIAPLVKRFSEETQQIAGCGVADEMAAKLGADVVNRDGIKIRDLPAPLQQVMLDLQIGQSTPPYGSLQDGVRVFVLCGRDAPEVAASESFDEIMSRLEEERVNKRARIYLRDLRRDAVIEYN
ncbi:peptidylprolyl isomerase [Sphingorhabdus sp.]|uniref:peptidylprolyl isomerase n=1 Tax=Sphingorhabdus sp. TaxID=1902408 RepID=UPI0026025EEC|nr:peptidylprolyl isomerase [Sphingorhabdus sp.]MDH4399200.1 peptidylprolyl isomerase [Sphingorhabdus sp.]